MIRRSICTKTLPETDKRCLRVKAAASTGRLSIVVPWDYSMPEICNHKAAAAALASKLGWSGRWCIGTMSLSGWYYCFVMDTGVDDLEVTQ